MNYWYSHASIFISAWRSISIKWAVPVVLQTNREGGGALHSCGGSLVILRQTVERVQENQKDLRAWGREEAYAVLFVSKACREKSSSMGRRKYRPEQQHPTVPVLDFHSWRDKLPPWCSAETIIFTLWATSRGTTAWVGSPHPKVQHHPLSVFITSGALG
jgi:hypothetical protein